MINMKMNSIAERKVKEQMIESEKMVGGGLWI